MHSTAEHDQTKHPLVRITTLGEFALERLVRRELKGLADMDGIALHRREQRLHPPAHNCFDQR
jgi:hypothetical protein